ncbi:probable LRR receptor-like serine/threonine-protein kinase At3g47570 [Actinidia eriantha]|uniref:probable LRR receptor-like serine/threonine-protein kinase At3g47570 n=1 Tax=Actinidia eriantha TaxID=165200 RepID=UPI00258AE94C|nr:probable LRR receptor-like serine/threonine-protein kinase At3g47570 [Actinidia eriantha]
MDFIASLANCNNLEVLGLQDNQFRGVLPSYVGNFSTKLFHLGLSGSYLYGNIPSWIGDLVGLTLITLRNHELSGSIPDNIGNLYKVQRLALSTNRFSGNIPTSIGNLTWLNDLYLHENSFEGSIPSSLGNCKSLIWFNLSQNNLTGTIPKELFSIPTLSVTLNLARNRLSGSLPLEVGKLINLAELDVLENDLSGEIPSSLGSCISLQNLYLQGNLFQGPIPSSFQYLRGIRNLDLSHNNLSGPIPPYLESFSTRNLNLSFNDLEGEVPIEGIFSNSSTISVVGNKRLCGGISELQLPKCTTEGSNKHKISLGTILIVSISSVVFGAIFLSSFVFCWLKKKREVQSSESSLPEPFSKVSYKRLHEATDRFSSANLIGVGSFGSVYKGILDQDEITIAVKVFNLQRRGASKTFVVECEALRNIRHRNLVKIVTSCSSVDFQGNDFKALVYEFMPNGSLERWLHPTNRGTTIGEIEFPGLTLLQRISIAIDVASAINYLHHHCPTPVIHCDLKPSNILLGSGMVARVGDFGLARFCPELTDPKQSSSIGIRGTIGYAAPEYGLGRKVSTSGDVYSYGILLLEMMTGKRPTDPMFGEGFNLHNFARMALPDRVMEIVEPLLLKNDVDNVSLESDKDQSVKWERDGNIKEHCLISLIKIGVTCSMESPHDRMDIRNVVHDLNLVRDLFQKA